jgi:5-methylcytosine-specific restriction endonuclease McrA
MRRLPPEQIRKLRAKKKSTAFRKKCDDENRRYDAANSVGQQGQPVPAWKLAMQARPSGTTRPLSLADHFRLKRRGHGQPPPANAKKLKLDQIAAVAEWESYDAYMRSDQWYAVRRRFKAMWPGVNCVGCGSIDIQLHHTTYVRFGREDLTDLLPLCQRCHSRLHETHKRERIALGDYVKALRLTFAWSPERVAERLADYRSYIH